MKYYLLECLHIAALVTANDLLKNKTNTAELRFLALADRQHLCQFNGVAKSVFGSVWASISVVAMFKTISKKCYAYSIPHYS